MKPLRLLFLNPVAPGMPVMVRSGRCQVKVNPGMGLWPPMDLAEVAGAVTGPGREIRILDAVAERLPFQEMLGQAAAFAPDLLFLLTSTPSLFQDCQVVSALRKACPGFRAVFFGVHVTTNPRDALDRGVDFVLRGEPEQGAKALVDAWKQPPLDAPGLSWLEAGIYRENPLAEPPAMDDLPRPRRDLLDNRRYRLPTTGRPFTILKTSRGCPFSCGYCTAHAYHGAKHRRRSVAGLAGEVESCHREFGLDTFLFLSDTFNLHQDWLLEVCGRLEALPFPITFYANSRADLLNREQAQAMKRAGAALLSLGIESGSETLLKGNGKPVNLDRVVAGIAAAREAGLQTLGYFILGLPGETAETMEETIRFAAGLPIDYAQFYTPTPFPGTTLYTEAQAANRLFSTDWSRYWHGASDVYAPEGLTPEQLSVAVRRAYRVFYTRPGRVFRELGRWSHPASWGPKLRTAAHLVRFWKDFPRAGSLQPLSPHLR